MKKLMTILLCNILGLSFVFADTQFNNLENKLEYPILTEKQQIEKDADNEVFTECKNERNSYCENFVTEVIISPYEESKENIEQKQ